MVIGSAKGVSGEAYEEGRQSLSYRYALTSETTVLVRPSRSATKA